MTIKSGQRYKITNEDNGKIFDMARWGWYRHRYGRSIHAWDFHGEENQQWITERQDDGQWTIRTVEPQMYLGFRAEITPKDGTPLDGLDKPQLWEIEVLPDSEGYDNPRVTFWVRGTLLVVEGNKEKTDREPLQLWAATEGRKQQIWLLEEYS